MTSEIIYTEDAGVGVIHINRPEARNALNWSAQDRFASVVDDLFQDGGPSVLIITGTGDRAFVSGGDLKELAGQDKNDTAQRLSLTVGTALEKLTRFPIPVIGAVNGDAIGGGCEILTACDFRIAAGHAQFQFAQIKVALSTGWGGTARLIRLINLSRSMELIMTGRRFSADEARKIGFVHRVVGDQKNVLDEAREWANELMELPGDALAAAKHLLWHSSQIPLENGYQLERQQFVDLWRQKDHIEAMAAFIQKRPAQFGKES